MSDSPPPPSGHSSLVDLLRFQAGERPTRRAFTFLSGGERETDTLTFEELDRAARAVAAQLQALGLAGERALLVYRPGLDFVAAFFGCLYAQGVAVPAYPPKPGQKMTRLQGIAGDARPRVVLTTGALSDLREKLGASPEFKGVQWVATDEPSAVGPESWRAPSAGPATLAILQYTSGSTGIPKGVMITHGNLLHNQRIIQLAFGHTQDTVSVSWLPLFHDMGLIGQVLQPVYLGVHCVLMAPEAFLQKPVRWLAAISRYRATSSGGPNFAYELCVNRVSPQQKEGLDLSSWDLAFNGAEPVRRSTLEKFSAAFGPCGFRRASFYPCYGLAEATLMVTGGDKASPPLVAEVDAASLAEHRVQAPILGRPSRSVVGCGRSFLGQRVLVVDPESDRAVGDSCVGEVWVSGPSVAGGYWNRPDLTARSFGALLAGDGNERFLRTDDLGFMHGGELFITGRLKDLIIIRGQNHYPQDIELTVRESHPALGGASGAAFSIELDGSERLVVVHEVDRSHQRSLDGAQAIEAARSAIVREHGVEVHAISLIEPMSLLRTSSGKVRRQACREAFLEGGLRVLAAWTAAEEAPPPEVHSGIARPDPAEDRAGELVDWLRAYANERVNSRLIDERRCIPPYIVLDLGNRGVLGLQVPERWGGLGFNHRETLRVFVQLAAIDLTLASFVGVHHSLGTRPILNFATPGTRDALLPALARGRELASFAITEPGAGSNPRALASVARPHDGGGWRLRGSKVWIGTASWSGTVNVFVRQLDEKGDAVGITGFVLRQGIPGLRQGPEALTMGMRGMVQNSVFLEDAVAGPEQVLGRQGHGFEVAQDAMMHGRLGLGAISLGGMKRCAQLMVRYARRRAVSTGSLLANPVTRARLSRLTAAITALEALLETIAGLLDEGRSLPEEAYIACKICGPEFLWEAADSLVQLLGGRGYVETSPAPQILRDARLLRIFEGPTETLSMYLGSRVLHRGEELRRFITADLGSPSVAQLLAGAAEEIRTRVARDGDRLPGPAAEQWASFLTGQAAAWAILAASVEGSARASKGEAVRRAAEWARLSLERAVAAARTASPDEAVLLDADTASDFVSSYSQSIGDVEQTLAGEDQSADELLRQAGPAASAGSPALEAPPLARTPVDGSTPMRRGQADIEGWIVRWLAKALKTTAEAIDTRKSFFDFGLDSVRAVELAQDLEDWLGRSLELDATVAWSFPNVERLAAHLAERSGVQPSVPAPAEPMAARQPPPVDPTSSPEALEASILRELVELEGLLEQGHAQPSSED